MQIDAFNTSDCLEIHLLSTDRSVELRLLVHYPSYSTLENHLLSIYRCREHRQMVHKRFNNLRQNSWMKSRQNS
jgi:hypothetical protein